MTAVLDRFEAARTSTIVGKFGEPTGRFELGDVNPLEVGSALQVLLTGAPARSTTTSSSVRASPSCGLSASGQRRRADHGRRRDLGRARRRVATGRALPVETEHRLQAFAELVGLAVASADARDELAASRLRIVEASDTERRRFERNLHDGAQQRLVALALGLRLAQSEAACQSPRRPSELLEEFSHELAQALAELRELAQGIHPAVLTERGLEPRWRCWPPGRRSRSSSTWASPSACRAGRDGDVLHRLRGAR